MYPLGPEDPRMYEKITTTELNQLFGAARAGSRQALEYLLMALRRRIYRKARRYTAGRPQVIGPSSLTQEVSLSLSRLITRVRGSSNATLFGLVNRMIQTKGATAFRRDSAMKRDGGWRESWDENNDLSLDSAANPHERLEQTQRDHRLLVAIAKLPPRQRIAIEGVLLGQSIPELAARLCCSAAAVSNLLQRSKHQLEPAESASVPDALGAALVSYLQTRRQGGRLDAAAFAAQYPGQEESLLSFLSWLDRLQQAWHRAADQTAPAP